MITTLINRPLPWLFSMSDIQTDMKYVWNSLVFSKYFVCFSLCQIYRQTCNIYIYIKNQKLSIVFCMLLSMSDIQTDMKYVSKSIVVLSILYAFLHVRYKDRNEICIQQKYRQDEAMMEPSTSRFRNKSYRFWLRRGVQLLRPFPVHHYLVSGLPPKG